MEQAELQPQVPSCTSSPRTNPDANAGLSLSDIYLGGQSCSGGCGPDGLRVCDSERGKTRPACFTWPNPLFLRSVLQSESYGAGAVVSDSDKERRDTWRLPCCVHGLSRKAIGGLRVALVQDGGDVGVVEALLVVRAERGRAQSRTVRVLGLPPERKKNRKTLTRAFSFQTLQSR
ncbi:hypothetical protein EYF80_048993 [Liparis tanakae]|uniref:Uncharacterized protein n=1 Tax=Liparis tanakae TaxID=230148 RepID=A0A4Z2FHY6_9TELE|nr:hypothetical protein EYF80_048993 [Liparis tanakae]